MIGGLAILNKLIQAIVIILADIATFIISFFLGYGTGYFYYGVMNLTDPAMFGAIGTWFSGICTLLTLIFLIYQNYKTQKRQDSLENKQNQLWESQQVKIKFEMHQTHKREFFTILKSIEKKYNNRFSIHDKLKLYKTIAKETPSDISASKEHRTPLPTSHELHEIDTHLDRCFTYIECPGIPPEIDPNALSKMDFINSTDKILNSINIEFKAHQGNNAVINTASKKTICDLIQPYDLYLFIQDIIINICDLLEKIPTKNSRGVGFFNPTSPTISGLTNEDFVIRNIFFEFCNDLDNKMQPYYKCLDIHVAKSLQETKDNRSMIESLYTIMSAEPINLSELENHFGS